MCNYLLAASENCGLVVKQLIWRVFVGHDLHILYTGLYRVVEFSHEKTVWEPQQATAVFHLRHYSEKMIRAMMTL